MIFLKKSNLTKKFLMKQFMRKSLNINYLYSKWKPKLLPEKGPRIEMGKRKLLNLHMKCLISSWIDEKISPYNKNNLPYEFQLILQGMRDGFSRSTFEE